jgi:signal transduction histidine kinase
MTVVTLIGFMTALVLQRLGNLRKDIAPSPAILAFTFLFPLASIALTFIFAVTSDPSPLVGGVAAAIIFGANVLVFWLQDRLSAMGQARLQAALQARENAYYLEQCRIMGEALEQTRAARHDMKAHLAAISSFAADGRTGEIADYVGNLLGGLEADRTYSGTGNAAFDGIVNYKFRDAKRLGVSADLTLLVSPNLGVDASDLAIILGNLLDNAMEAATDAREKWVSLVVEQAKGTLFIQVRNGFDGRIAYAKGRGKNRLPATSKPDGDGGQGLKNVRRAIEKYDGYMKITHEATQGTTQGGTQEATHQGGTFSVAILLYENRGKDSRRAPIPARESRTGS